MGNIVKFATDTLYNVISGMGMGSKDKKVSDRFGLRLLTRVDMENSYRGDWIARKVIDIIPRDMTREWRSWQASKTQIEKLEAEEKRLQVRSKVMRAKTLARLYGGSAILLGDGTDKPNLPLLPDTITAGGLKYLCVLNRYQITPQELIRDPLSPFFGEPNAYEISSPDKGAVMVHPSRVVRFLGNDVPDHATAEMNGWGDSVLQALYDAVHNAANCQDNIASLINEAKLDIIRIPGLMDQVSTAEYESRLIKRFQVAGVGKSIHNTLILDKEEEWEQRQLSFSGMPEIIHSYLEIAAGAADIPVMRLLGLSPKGLNATGAADIRNYYDSVASQQESDLRPNLERMDELLIRSALGKRPASVWYRFNSLWQMTDAEKSDNNLKKAQATNLYGRLGVMSRDALAQAVQNQLIEAGFYPGLEEILKDPKARIPSEPIGGKTDNGPPDKPNPATDKQPDLFEA